jgi:Tfp pilus assembly protein PilE
MRNLNTIFCINDNRHSRGITIVEIAIIIALIGLVAITTITGISLYEKGKIRMQISQLKQYKSAYDTFKIEYKAIPGDYDLASEKWAGTPNGDGNGRLNEDAATVDALSAEYEMIKFFQHLYESNYIEENFYNSALINIGFPNLKIDSSKGMLAYGSDISSSHRNFQVSKKTARTFIAGLGLNVSRTGLGFSNQFNDAIGTATPEAYSIIDNKIDDGKARSGTFIAHTPLNSTEGDCLTGIDGDYFIKNNKPACHAVYILEDY